MGHGRPAALNDPFLVDECLSPQLAAEAQRRGFAATHVAHRDLIGSADHELMKLIRSENFILVTNNARDFRRLYAAEDFHSGLVIIIPGGLTLQGQQAFFGRILDYIQPLDQLTNKLVEIALDGVVTIQDWPVR